MGLPLPGDDAEAKGRSLIRLRVTHPGGGGGQPGGLEKERTGQEEEERAWGRGSRGPGLEILQVWGCSPTIQSPPPP